MSKDGGQCTIEQMSHILPQSSPSRPRMDMSPPYNREGDSPGSRGVDSEAQNRRTFSELEWQSEIPERIEDASKPGIKMSDPPTPSFTSSRSPPERERETDTKQGSGTSQFPERSRNRKVPPRHLSPSSDILRVRPDSSSSESSTTNTRPLSRELTSPSPPVLSSPMSANSYVPSLPTSSSSPALHETVPIVSLSSSPSLSVPKFGSISSVTQISSSSDVAMSSTGITTQLSNEPKLKRRKKIETNSGSLATTTTTTSLTPPRDLNRSFSATELDKWQTELETREKMIAESEKQLAIMHATQVIASYEDNRLRGYERRLRLVESTLLRFVRQDAQQSREKARQRMRENLARLGYIMTTREGMHIVEKWIDGKAFDDVNARLLEIARERQTLEDQRKILATAKKRSAKEFSAEEIADRDELYKIRLKSLKKEELDLQSRVANLAVEKDLFIRELKRIRAENQSKFNDYRTLNEGQYLLMELLGKGGFSEVYKVYDFHNCRICALKIHQLVSSWPEERKQSYLKHAQRECEIQAKIEHHKIVRLHNSFIVDHETFCTVLEYCEGGDLDQYLKINRTIKEDEAKSIISQVFLALRYLNRPDLKIIHYDLKPANILFSRNGEVKITDFGLSKVMADSQESMMELTSQGAGTYWYLPPECFDTSSVPYISGKVDVWSAGVVLYQMLFGIRPFGHDLSQQRILSDNVILNLAREVRFPSTPKISPEAKSFIQRCLSYNVLERPDVHDLCADPFLQLTQPRPKKPSSATSSSTVSTSSGMGSSSSGSSTSPGYLHPGMQSSFHTDDGGFAMPMGIPRHLYPASNSYGFSTVFGLGSSTVGSSSFGGNTGISSSPFGNRS